MTPRQHVSPEASTCQWYSLQRHPCLGSWWFPGSGWDVLWWWHSWCDVEEASFDCKCNCCQAPHKSRRTSLSHLSWLGLVLEVLGMDLALLLSILPCETSIFRTACHCLVCWSACGAPEWHCSWRGRCHNHHRSGSSKCICRPSQTAMAVLDFLSHLVVLPLGGLVSLACRFCRKGCGKSLVHTLHQQIYFQKGENRSSPIQFQLWSWRWLQKSLPPEAAFCLVSMRRNRRWKARQPPHWHWWNSHEQRTSGRASCHLETPHPGPQRPKSLCHKEIMCEKLAILEQWLNEKNILDICSMCARIDIICIGTSKTPPPWPPP